MIAQSRLSAVKNVEMVVRGVAEVRRRGHDVVLEVAGEGPERQRLEALADRELASAVRFHGYLSRPDLDALMADCDVFALLPFDEPFGMVFVEAMLRGLVVVGPDHGGPIEILEGGALGFTSSVVEPAGLADRLEEILLLSDAEIDRRRERAHRACLDRFRPATFAAHVKKTIGAAA